MSNTDAPNVISNESRLASEFINDIFMMDVQQLIPKYWEHFNDLCRLLYTRVAFLDEDTQKQLELRLKELDIAIDSAGPQSPIKHLLEAIMGQRTLNGARLDWKQRLQLAAAGVISGTGWIVGGLQTAEAVSSLSEAGTNTGWQYAGVAGGIALLGTTGWLSTIPWGMAVKDEIKEVAENAKDTFKGKPSLVEQRSLRGFGHAAVI